MKDEECPSLFPKVRLEIANICSQESLLASIHSVHLALADPWFNNGNDQRELLGSYG